MRKPILLLLVIAAVLALAACGGAPSPAATTTAPTSAPTTAATTAPTRAATSASAQTTPSGAATSAATSAGTTVASQTTPAASTPSGAQATAPAGSPTPVVARGRLATVLNRKKLVCGINGSLAGFSTLEASGDYSGLDVEFCKAIASALFNDPKAVEYRKLNTTERFAAIQNGEVDVVFRNTTYTLNRDSAVGVDFGPTTFYDGGGMMVPKKNNIKKLEDLNGATICVLTGTTNEQVLADVFKARNIKYTPLTFNDAAPLYQAYEQGRCDAVTSDKSQLAGQRASLLKTPDDHTIMDDTLSKEPLTPMIAQNDSQWKDVVTWVVYATWYGEELGVTSKNVDQMKSSDDVNVKRLLGATGTLGKDMALTNDAFYQVIKLVGNYGEIYDRTLGPSTKFNVPRGLNQPYNKGGIQYSPPFR